MCRDFTGHPAVDMRLTSTCWNMIFSPLVKPVRNRFAGFTICLLRFKNETAAGAIQRLLCFRLCLTFIRLPDRSWLRRCNRISSIIIRWCHNAWRSILRYLIRGQNNCIWRRSLIISSLIRVRIPPLIRAATRNC
jgi:hypothetical protein